MDNSKKKRFAEMTNDEIVAWLIRWSTGEPYAALRDAIRAEALEEVLNKDNAVLRDLEAAIHTYRTRAERAERERDEQKAEATAARLRVARLDGYVENVESRLRTAEQERDSWREQVQRGAKIYFDIADATLRTSTGPEDIIAEIYRLREAERTAQSALGEARRLVVQDVYNRIAAMDAIEVSAHKWVLDRAEVLHVIRAYPIPELDAPATPSGEGDAYDRVMERVNAHQVSATPQPSERVGYVDRDGYLDIPVTQEVDSYIRITAKDARRLVNLGLTPEAK